jgi:hypothetical protein
MSFRLPQDTTLFPRASRRARHLGAQKRTSSGTASLAFGLRFPPFCAPFGVSIIGQRFHFFNNTRKPRAIQQKGIKAGQFGNKYREKR